MTTKHTEGPWRADGPPHNRIVWSDDVTLICFMAHSDGADDAGDIARSNLVAAAPELLKALVTVRHQWAGHSEACAFVKDHYDKCDCDWPEIARRCDAAIAQAKGEAG